MKELVKDFDSFSIWQITGSKELKALSRLVIEVNYKHHLNQSFYPDKELEKIYFEDNHALPHSTFYSIYDQYDEMIAAIKCQKWNSSNVLAIEKDFNINLKYFVQSLNFQPSEIFHIGRFVIDQEKICKNKPLREKRLTILKLLMYHALLPIYKNDSNIFFCECDEKLFSKLNFLGLYPQIIGSPKEYLGSTTLPIYCDYSGVKEFFIINKHINYV